MVVKLSGEWCDVLYKVAKLSEFMYKLPKNRVVLKCPVCSLSGMVEISQSSDKNNFTVFWDMVWCVVQGRSGNSWLSLDGCAMFSVHVRVSTSSHLGQRVSFVQHLMSLAVVLAVRRKPNCHVCMLLLAFHNTTLCSLLGRRYPCSSSSRTVRTYRLTWHKLNTIASRTRYTNCREKN